MDKALFEETTNVARDLANFHVNYQGTLKDFYERDVYQFTSQVTYNQCFDAVDACMANEQMDAFFQDKETEKVTNMVMASIFTVMLVSAKIINEVKADQQSAGVSQKEKEENRTNVENALKSFNSVCEECCLSITGQDKEKVMQKLQQMKEFVSTCFPDIEFSAKSAEANPK